MRQLLCVLMLLQLAGGASAALFLDPDGRGQVLIVPYFTVNAGNDSLLVITNHTDDAKALKLRVREGQNGRVLTAFNVYLAPYDSWTAGIFSLTPDAPAAITTPDNSCTVPALRRIAPQELPVLPNGQPYKPFSDADYTGTRDDAGADGLARTREGWIEVIEMGVLQAGSAAYQATLTPTSTPPFNFNGLPDCAWFLRAWSGGAFSTDPDAQLSPPGGGLSARLFIVAVPDGTAVSMRATAIGGFSRRVQHTGPGSDLPDLSSARSEATDTGFVATQVRTSQGIVRSTWPISRAIDAVSALLMRSEVGAEVTVETGLGASTEWVLAQVTRPWYTDQARVGDVARMPYAMLFPAPGMPVATRPDCEQFQVRFHDREGVFRTTSDLIFGLPDVPISTCNAAQVMSFHQGIGPSRILGSGNRQNLYAAQFANGQVQLEFATSAQRRLVSHEGHAYLGLPLIGHSFERFENIHARPGVAGFYAESSALTGSVRCRMPDGAGGETDCEALD